MGQSLRTQQPLCVSEDSPSEAWASGIDDEDGQESSRGDGGVYEGFSLAELRRTASRRGLLGPSPAAASGDGRAVLLTALRAYDAGAAAAAAAACDISARIASGHWAEPLPTPRMLATALSVLQKIRDAPGHMGCDIGGTLVKMALALPREVADEYVFPETFGHSGRAHRHLELDLELDTGEQFVLRFVSGSTVHMELAVQHLERRRRKSLEETNQDTSPGFSRRCSDWSDDVFSHSCRTIRRIATAGGGACKFAPLFRDALRVEMEVVKELSAAVDGLLLLAPRALAQSPSNSFGARISSGGDEVPDLFTIDENGSAEALPWPDELFPLLLVNMGSGVSILRVDSASEGDYVRVGGTACGGGTFLGLARALTSARTFDEALALAQRGDAGRVDKLVSDIYGEDGCANLGLPGALTASNFGKLCDDRRCEDEPNSATCSEADLARAVLQMVTQQSVLLATAFAHHAGCVGRVFFVGGFVDEPNWIARKAIAANFRSLGGCAYFLRHSDFLGALGSLRCVLRALGGSQ